MAPANLRTDARRTVTRRSVLVGGASIAVAIISGCAGSSKGDGESSVGPGASNGTGGARAVPDPVASVVHRWSADPLAGGTYSFLPPGVTDEARATLAVPVGPRLVLAGEATSVEHPSTVPGALESGRRAAEQLAEVDPADAPIVVVGAGIAGLAAARDLTDAGYEVVVLDARDRVGGRVTSVELAGTPVDLGAGWIEGSDGNPMTAIAEDLGISLVETDWSDAIVRRRGGATVDPNEVATAVETVDQAIADAVATGIEDEDERPFDMLLADVLGFDPADPGNESQVLVAWAVDAAITYDLAADPAQLGAVGVDEGEAFDGPELMLRGGYGQVPAALADALDVRLGATVVDVAYDETGVVVTLGDGSTVEGAAAVVTVPIGVLQSGDLGFDPPLPAPVRAAVDAIDMGVLTKVFVRFDEVFWDDDVDVIGYLDPDAPGTWATWVNLTELTGEPILLGLNGGRRARALEAEGDDAVVASAMAALRAMYG